MITGACKCLTLLLILSSFETVPVRKGIRLPKEQIYNQNLLLDDFMVLAKYLISNIPESVEASANQEASEATAEAGDPDPEGESGASEEETESSEHYLVVYGKTREAEAWKFLTEAYFALSHFPTRLLPAGGAEQVDVSFLSDADHFEVTLTNNLVFR